jgi:ferritin
MISNGMAARINAQLNRELYSAYFYLGVTVHTPYKKTVVWRTSKRECAKIDA